jgi:hypothetical protein
LYSYAFLFVTHQNGIVVFMVNETKDEEMNVCPVCGKASEKCECSEETASGESGCGCGGNCGCGGH